MKNLQNNFTTPQQSKRLLELGVPADSADCYYFTESSIIPLIAAGDKKGTPLYPCWSLGRLIDIYEIVCKDAPQCITTKINRTRIENIISLYEENVLLLDFSKLED